jgi:hypothetical protein
MKFDQLETREASSRKMYTGFAPIQIIGVNPTAKELAKILNLEVDKIKEPVYEGENGMRLDFWYVNHPDFKTDLRGKFSLWVNNDTRMSQAGKKQFIDNFTKTTWAENLATLSEYQASIDPSRRLDMKSVREAKGGEETVYSLLKAYGNISPKEKPFVLDNWASIAKGKGNELVDFFAHFNKADMGVKVLLGIKDGKYQDVCTKVFVNLHGKVTEYVSKQITGEYGFKSYYGTYTFKEYTENDAPEANETESPFKESNQISWDAAPSDVATASISSESNILEF